jgi:mono/diheme cytochrome c family protein
MADKLQFDLTAAHKFFPPIISTRLGSSSKKMIRNTLSFFTLLAAAVLAACRASADNTPTPTLTALEQRGQAVFNLRCAQCHTLVPDTVVIGPSLAGVATRAGSRVPGMDALQYIETSILYPKDYLVPEFTDTMPTNFSKELTSEEFEAVVAFLMTLK